MNIISYCNDTYPSIGGVARYDTQLKLIFPNRIFFKAPQQRSELLEYLKTCDNPIIITDNHMACDIPNEYPVLLVHHGCALTHAEREPDWNLYWKNLCCSGQEKMLYHRNPNNTWIISCSTFCTEEFTKYFKELYTSFKILYVPHSSELNENIYKEIWNDSPVILGNFTTNHKGKNIIEKLINHDTSKNNLFKYSNINVYPDKEESLNNFNNRKQQRYIESDIFLQMSLHEGNSYSTLDALMNGLVIVCTDVGLFYKDVPEDCFVKIPWEKFNDVDYIIKKISHAWKNKDILSKNARNFYMSNFRFSNWKNIMTKIVDDFYNFYYNN
jgi:glycosyltransferase involved in cell wall biosynthesis